MNKTSMKETDSRKLEIKLETMKIPQEHHQTLAAGKQVKCRSSSKGEQN